MKKLPYKIGDSIVVRALCKGRCAENDTLEEFNTSVPWGYILATVKTTEPRRRVYYVSEHMRPTAAIVTGYGFKSEGHMSLSSVRNHVKGAKGYASNFIRTKGLMVVKFKFTLYGKEECAFIHDTGPIESFDLPRMNRFVWRLPNEKAKARVRDTNGRFVKREVK